MKLDPWPQFSDTMMIQRQEHRRLFSNRSLIRHLAEVELRRVLYSEVPSQQQPDVSAPIWTHLYIYSPNDSPN